MNMRTFRVIACATALALVSACAQAGSFTGKWIGMKKGDVLTITRTGGSYLGKTQQGFPLYLREVGGKLVGDVLHNAKWKVTIQFDSDDGHLLATLPGLTQEYQRASR